MWYHIIEPPVGIIYFNSRTLMFFFSAFVSQYRISTHAFLRRKNATFVMWYHIIEPPVGIIYFNSRIFV